MQNTNKDESNESKELSLINDNTNLIAASCESDLNVNEEQVIQNIINAPTKEALEQQFELFNITQSKKNAIRVSKLNKLLDMIEDQAFDRFAKRPDQVSNKEILEYMNVISSQIERSKNNVNNDLQYKPTIQVMQNTTEVNLNMGSGELDRDSKEKVMDVISGLLKQVERNTAASDNNSSDGQAPIDITDDIEEDDEDFSNPSQDLLYNEDDD